ncbi:hypothetical protein GOP47_0004705 [Adiantum capillus-veneris]|uniref:Uncharacterized protein n=1 Tax=Adiantum capillus-veneris TaxID=13818 RepID=A0A9D4V9R3_ADICA|nr:hypothetical protein GOP47_0004705 [Adiantum capillus-veneris]
MESPKSSSHHRHQYYYGGFLGLLNVEPVMLLHILPASSCLLIGLGLFPRPDHAPMSFLLILSSCVPNFVLSLLSGFQFCYSAFYAMMRAHQLAVLLVTNFIIMALLCTANSGRAASDDAGTRAAPLLEMEQPAADAYTSTYSLHSIITAEADDEEYSGRGSTDEVAAADKNVNGVAIGGSDIHADDEKRVEGSVAPAIATAATADSYMAAITDQRDEAAAEGNEELECILNSSNVLVDHASERASDVMMTKILESLSNEEANKRFSEFAARKWARIRSVKLPARHHQISCTSF